MRLFLTMSDSGSEVCKTIIIGIIIINHISNCGYSKMKSNSNCDLNVVRIAFMTSCSV